MTRFVEDLGILLDNVLPALIVSKNVVNIIIFYILMKTNVQIFFFGSMAMFKFISPYTVVINILVNSATFPMEF